jgi:hypothetical protein
MSCWIGGGARREERRVSYLLIISWRSVFPINFIKEATEIKYLGFVAMAHEQLERESSANCQREKFENKGRSFSDLFDGAVVGLCGVSAQGRDQLLQVAQHRKHRCDRPLVLSFSPQPKRWEGSAC